MVAPQSEKFLNELTKVKVTTQSNLASDDVEAVEADKRELESTIEVTVTVTVTAYAHTTRSFSGSQKTPPLLSTVFERVGREALCTRRAQAVRPLEPREHTPLDLLCIAHLYVRIATT